MRVLLTGAVGFIGSAIRSRLHTEGHDVVGVDALISQAHHGLPDVAADVHVLDVRDAPSLTRLLRGVDVVCHQAAMVGAGVTLGDLPAYAAHNDLGTATLLASMHEAGVRRLVLASSMVVYGEGRYRCSTHGDQAPGPRSVTNLDAGSFENSCPDCSRPLTWATVPEDARLDPRNGYAASKVAQEHYTAAWVRQLAGHAVALRYHNVYGPGMPQDSPYSGVAAIFRSSLERGESPRVFEDGGQMRDFVHVEDVARANLLALESVTEGHGAGFAAFNICSGRPVSILDVARRIGADRGIEPRVTGEYRLGDVRHVVASPDRARDLLGFDAAIDPVRGLASFATAPLR